MIESNQSNNSSKSSPTRTSAAASVVTTTTSIPPVCCEFFIDTLNRLYKDVNLNNNDTNKSDEIINNNQDNLIVKPVLSPLDVISFLNYCHIWQQK